MTGADVVRWMERQGLTGDALAKKVGRSPRQVDTYRKYGVPETVRLALAAVELGVSADWAGDPMPMKLTGWKDGGEE